MKSIQEERDSGVIFDTKLNFVKHINSVIAKANRVAYLLSRTFTFYDKKLFTLLFTALVRSNLEHAVSVWAPFLKKHIIAI